MKSSTKRSRRKTQPEATREKRQRDPVSDGEVEETEIVFRSSEPPTRSSVAGTKIASRFPECVG